MGSHVCARLQFLVSETGLGTRAIDHQRLSTIALNHTDELLLCWVSFLLYMFLLCSAGIDIVQALLADTNSKTCGNMLRHGKCRPAACCFLRLFESNRDAVMDVMDILCYLDDLAKR